MQRRGASGHPKLASAAWSVAWLILLDWLWLHCGVNSAFALHCIREGEGRHAIDSGLQVLEHK